MTYNENELEPVFIKLHSSNQTTKIGCIYRPPCNEHDNFLEKFNSIISRLQINSSNCIICGDFNYCLIKASNGSIRDADFYETATSFSLLPVIKKPTRIASRNVDGTITESISAIDNILTNCLSNVQPGLFSDEISDHMPIFAVFKNYFCCVNENIKKSFRQCYEQNLNNLAFEFVNSINIDELVSLNVDESIGILHQTILDCYNTCCPIKTKNISQNSRKKPWLTNEIKNQIKKKQNLFVLLKNHKISREYFNVFRNQVVNLIRQAKKDYYNNLFSDIKRDTKQTWKVINSILKPGNKSSSNLVKNIVIGNQTYENTEEIANIFNTHFSTVGKNISESFQFDPNLRNFDNIRSPVNSFKFNHVTSEDVRYAILSLKNKSCPISMYPNSILKFLEPYLSPILASIINKSFRTGTFPRSLKIAKVIPIHKGAEKNDVSNYRPISILPPISKIFEKIIFKQILSFLEKYALLSDNQYGFRPKRSTIQAVLNNLNYIYENLDNDYTVIALFLDFSKAFDCIDH